MFNFYYYFYISFLFHSASLHLIRYYRLMHVNLMHEIHVGLRTRRKKQQQKKQSNQVQHSFTIAFYSHKLKWKWVNEVKQQHWITRTNVHNILTAKRENENSFLAYHFYYHYYYYFHECFILEYKTKHRFIYARRTIEFVNW